MHTTMECTIDQKDSIKNAMQGALSLFNAGLKIFPVWKNGKNPLIKKDPKHKNSWELWALEKCSETSIRNYGVNDCNWAVATGPSNLIVVDIDTKTYDGYQTLKALEDKYENLPKTFTVLTPSGGKHLYFWDVKNIGNSGTNTLGMGIDTRGKGGYVVAPYSSINQTSYTVESNSQVADCPDFIYTELLEVSKAKKKISQDKLDNFDESLLENSVGLGDRNRFLYEKACGLRGSGLPKNIITTTLYEINDLYCDPPLSSEEIEIIAESASKYKPNQTSAVLDFAPVTTQGLDPLEAHRDLMHKEEGIRPRKKISETCTNFSKIDTGKIQSLEWIIKGIYLKRKVGIIAADGGTGKSILTLQQCVAVATGRGDVIGEHVDTKMNCWFHNGEDSTEDISRRLSAITQHFGIHKKETERLFYTGAEQEMILFKKTNNDTYAINRKLILEIKDFINTNNIKIWVADPLVTFYESDENSTKDMDRLMRIFIAIAEETNCSILLSSHVNKASNSTTAAAQSVRGSSALVAAARIVLTARPMSEQEEREGRYEKFDTTDYLHKEVTFGKINARKKYVRLDSAKQNFASNSKREKWFKFISVKCRHKGGIDDVGVLEPVQITEKDPNTLHEVREDINALTGMIHNVMGGSDIMSVINIAKELKGCPKRSGLMPILSEDEHRVRDFIVKQIKEISNSQRNDNTYPFIVNVPEQDNYRYVMGKMNHSKSKGKPVWCIERRLHETSFLE